ncbi:MAG: acyl-CoA reductase, partial [Betaproteobacteria bacterium]|nr:acyl-CoA reductase [Betaproteobacteria bacterium]
SPSALLRSVEVMAVDDLHQVPSLIEPRRAWLQTVGVATSPERLLELAASLGQVGVTRVCALGSMTAPQAGWHHDGRFSLLDLVRIVEVDATALVQSDAFAPYRD